jgi:hypothetical protein
MNPSTHIIAKTGISEDYKNEYAPKVEVLKQGGLEAVAEHFRKYPVKKYKERLFSQGYDVFVNYKNGNAIKRLDEIAETANAKFTDANNFSTSDFLRAVNEVFKIIYGEPHMIFNSDVKIDKDFK